MAGEARLDNASSIRNIWGDSCGALATYGGRATRLETTLLPWLNESLFLSIALVLSAIVTVLLFTGFKNAWHTSSCPTYLSCVYKTALMPWSSLTFIMALATLLWGKGSDGVDSLIVYAWIILTPIAQLSILVTYTKNGHLHKK